MKTCKVCGETKPLTKEYWPPAKRMADGFRNECKSCTAESARNRRKNDPDFRAKQAAANKANYERNRDARIANQMRVEAEISADPERKAKRSKQRAAAHDARMSNEEYADKRRAQSRASSAIRRADPEYRKKQNQKKVERLNANPERRKLISQRSVEWARQNRDAAKAVRHRYRARKVSAEGTYNASDVQEILEYQNYKCHWCRADIRGKHVMDHYMPLCKGGTNDKYNLVASCNHCNCSKKEKTPDEFREYRKRLYGQP